MKKNILMLCAILAWMGCNKPSEPAQEPVLEIEVEIFTGEAANITYTSADLSAAYSIQNAKEVNAEAGFYISNQDMNEMSTLQIIANSTKMHAGSISSASGKYTLSLSDLTPVSTYYSISYISIGDKEYYGNIISVSTAGAGEIIDMGLSVKWRSCNLGALAPEMQGDLYAWGETETKATFSTDGYKWFGYNENGKAIITKYNVDSYFGSVDGKTVLEPEDDAAHVHLGYQWRMPTKEEVQELYSNCTLNWTTLNGQPVCEMVSSINGQSIFFPLWRYETWGEVWSSSLDENGCHRAWEMSILGNMKEVELFNGCGRESGCPIRAVWDD